MGKSASGKDAVYRNLIADEALKLKKVVMYTTRPMRKGETDGVQYFFSDEEGFERLLKDGKIIEERSYDTKLGLWRYFTADDGQIDMKSSAYLMMGTLETYISIRDYFGEDLVRPIYIEADDGVRLERALKRERRQEVPRYDEMCRRYLADDKDFAKEKLEAAGIERVFENDGELEDCLSEVKGYILGETE